MDLTAVSVKVAAFPSPEFARDNDVRAPNVLAMVLDRVIRIAHVVLLGVSRLAAHISNIASMLALVKGFSDEYRTNLQNSFQLLRYNAGITLQGDHVMPKKAVVVKGKSAAAPGQMKPAGSPAKPFAPGQMKVTKVKKSK